MNELVAVVSLGAIILAAGLWLVLPRSTPRAKPSARCWSPWA